MKVQPAATPPKSRPPEQASADAGDKVPPPQQAPAQQQEPPPAKSLYERDVDQLNSRKRAAASEDRDSAPDAAAPERKAEASRAPAAEKSDAPENAAGGKDRAPPGDGAGKAAQRGDPDQKGGANASAGADRSAPATPPSPDSTGDKGGAQPSGATAKGGETDEGGTSGAKDTGPDAPADKDRGPPVPVDEAGEAAQRGGPDRRGGASTPESVNRAALAASRSPDATGDKADSSGAKSTGSDAVGEDATGGSTDRADAGTDAERNAKAPAAKGAPGADQSADDGDEATVDVLATDATGEDSTAKPDADGSFGVQEYAKSEAGTPGDADTDDAGIDPAGSAQQAEGTDSTARVAAPDRPLSEVAAEKKKEMGSYLGDPDNRNRLSWALLDTSYNDAGNRQKEQIDGLQSELREGALDDVKVSYAPVIKSGESPSGSSNGIPSGVSGAFTGKGFDGEVLINQGATNQEVVVTQMLAEAVVDRATARGAGVTGGMVGARVAEITDNTSIKNLKTREGWYDKNDDGRNDDNSGKAWVDGKEVDAKVWRRADEPYGTLAGSTGDEAGAESSTEPSAEPSTGLTLAEVNAISDRKDALESITDNVDELKRIRLDLEGLVIPRNDEPDDALANVDQELSKMNTAVGRFKIATDNITEDVNKAIQNGATEEQLAPLRKDVREGMERVLENLDTKNIFEGVWGAFKQDAAEKNAEDERKNLEQTAQIAALVVVGLATVVAGPAGILGAGAAGAGVLGTGIVGAARAAAVATRPLAEGTLKSIRNATGVLRATAAFNTAVGAIVPGTLLGSSIADAGPTAPAKPTGAATENDKAGFSLIDFIAPSGTDKEKFLSKYVKTALGHMENTFRLEVVASAGLEYAKDGKDEKEFEDLTADLREAGVSFYERRRPEEENPDQDKNEGVVFIDDANGGGLLELGGRDSLIFGKNDTVVPNDREGGGVLEQSASYNLTGNKENLTGNKELEDTPYRDSLMALYNAELNGGVFRSSLGEGGRFVPRSSGPNKFFTPDARNLRVLQYRLTQAEIADKVALKDTTFNLYSGSEKTPAQAGRDIAEIISAYKEQDVIRKNPDATDKERYEAREKVSDAERKAGFERFFFLSKSRQDGANPEPLFTWRPVSPDSASRALARDRNLNGSQPFVDTDGTVVGEEIDGSIERDSYPRYESLRAAAPPKT